LSFHQSVQTTLGAPRILFQAHRELFAGVKRPGREADHSSPSIEEVGYKESPMFTAPHACMLWTWTTLPLYNPPPPHPTPSRLGKLKWTQLQYLNALPELWPFNNYSKRLADRTKL
jgi:hypothetical protein